MEWKTWPTVCASSDPVEVHGTGKEKKFLLVQRCCYTVSFSNWGALIMGPPHGGRVNIVKVETAGRLEKLIYFRNHNIIPYENCCVLSGSVKRCEEFYARRPSSNCLGYIPPTGSMDIFHFLTLTCISFELIRGWW